MKSWTSPPSFRRQRHCFGLWSSLAVLLLLWIQPLMFKSSGIMERLVRERYQEKVLSQTNNNKHVERFPRWGPNDNEPISFPTLVQFTHDVLSRKPRDDPSNNATTTERVRHHLPSSIYIIDSNYTTWTNNNGLRREVRKTLAKRMRPIEWLLLQAIEFFQSLLARGAEHPWKHLQRQIEEGGGLLFSIYYRDFVGCNHLNYRSPGNENGLKTSVPVFTMCARLDCDYAFPWPTYESITMAQPTRDNWRQNMQEAAQKYSQKPKRRQAVWRGSLTGIHNREAARSIRWRLAVLGNKYPELLDARLVNIPISKEDQEKRGLDLTEIGGLGSRIDMEDFQEYQAIIDCDGNAWSSRFAKLLCMDSVVIKIQPTMVDHFWWNELEAWKHYIPIGLASTANATADDLALEESVVSTITWIWNHPNETQQIINNAHNWCSQHMTVGSLGKDVLAILDDYARRWDISGYSTYEVPILSPFLEEARSPHYRMERLRTMLDAKKPS